MEGTLNLAIPGVLYAVANLVLYYGIGFLGAPVAQTLGQVKILVTAALACCLLRQRFSFIQLLCLVGLAVGAAVVTAGDLVSDWLHGSSDDIRSPINHAPQKSGLTIVDQDAEKSYGILAILVNCICGGLASVYFEYILKRSPGAGFGADQGPVEGQIQASSSSYRGLQDRLKTAASTGGTVGLRRIGSSSTMGIGASAGLLHRSVETSGPADHGPHRKGQSKAETIPPVAAQGPNIWIRNLQMSLWGLVFALGSALSSGHLASMVSGREHLTQGFTPTVWAAVGNQVVGGIVVALVIRQTSNVAKNFVTSLAIVLNAAASYAIWGDPLSIWFVAGACLVCVSTVGYACGAPPGKAKSEDGEENSEGSRSEADRVVPAGGAQRRDAQEAALLP